MKTNLKLARLIFSSLIKSGYKAENIEQEITSAIKSPSSSATSQLVKYLQSSNSLYVLNEVVYLSHRHISESENKEYVKVVCKEKPTSLDAIIEFLSKKIEKDLKVFVYLDNSVSSTKIFTDHGNLDFSLNLGLNKIKSCILQNINL